MAILCLWCARCNREGLLHPGDATRVTTRHPALNPVAIQACTCPCLVTDAQKVGPVPPFTTT